MESSYTVLLIVAAFFTDVHCKFEVELTSSDKGYVVVKDDQGAVGGVCQKGEDYNTCMVVCRQLGYNGGYFLEDVYYLYPEITIDKFLLANVLCNGQEKELGDCDYDTTTQGCHLVIHQAACTCHMPNGEMVAANPVLQHPTIELSSGYHGIVEVTRYGDTRLVCNRHWTDTECQVVCRQIGYSGGLSVYKASILYESRLHNYAWLDNVKCSGREAMLDQCQHDLWGDFYCNPSEDMAACQCNESIPVTTNNMDLPKPKTKFPMFLTILVVLLIVIITIMAVLVILVVFPKLRKCHCIGRFMNDQEVVAVADNNIINIIELENEENEAIQQKIYEPNNTAEINRIDLKESTCFELNPNANRTNADESRNETSIAKSGNTVKSPLNPKPDNNVNNNLNTFHSGKDTVIAESKQTNLIDNGTVEKECIKGSIEKNFYYNSSDVFSGDELKTPLLQQERTFTRFYKRSQQKTTCFIFNESTNSLDNKIKVEGTVAKNNVQSHHYYNFDYNKGILLSDESEDNGLELPLQDEAIEQSTVSHYIFKGTNDLKGLVLIINVMKFQNLEDRSWSDNDANWIQHTFKKAGFSIIQCDNPTKEDLQNTIENAQNKLKTRKHGCFVCFVMTHGELGKIYTSEDELLSIEDCILKPFATKNLPEFNGYPKMFFMQCCRAEEGGVNSPHNTEALKPLQDQEEERPFPFSSISGCIVNSSDECSHSDSSISIKCKGFTPDGEDPYDKGPLPPSADFFIGYACKQGQAAVRNEYIKGSAYIVTLCQHIKQKHGQTIDWISEINEFQKDVVKYSKYQCPIYFSTLTKQLKIKL